MRVKADRSDLPDHSANAVVFLTSSITAYVRVSRTPGSCTTTLNWLNHFEASWKMSL